MSSNSCMPDEHEPDSPGTPWISPHPSRETLLGSLPISRALPIRHQRMIGPWCFLDRFGPLTFEDETPMQVPPHPHIGLQTVTWLLAGEIRHTDSLGSEAVLRPGGLNLMTAGKGIAHAEETPPVNSGRLNGVQLWTALPEAYRRVEPSFSHLEQVPDLESTGGLIHIFAREYQGSSFSAEYFSEIIGLDLDIQPQSTLKLDLSHHFEHALLLLVGDASLEAQAMASKTLYTLVPGREQLTLRSQAGGRVLLIGGSPFREKILMWWNFVARTPDEIRKAKEDWDAQRHFGPVPGSDLPRLSAPDLGRLAQPNPAS